MVQRKQKIVLYSPRQNDPRSGEVASRDLVPLALLTIAGWPDRDGYEVLLIDGNLLEPAQAHRRVVEACEGALLYATTGILSYQVTDGLLCSRAVKAAYPALPLFIGGWFASAQPELQLATGLYEAVCLGQGEITFREIVQAVAAGASLDGVAGLALWRDGQVLRTEWRPAVGWDQLLNCPWHLLDIAPYRDGQLNGRPLREVPRFSTPPGHNDKPFFGLAYYSSFGCPESCTFCCSPEFSGRRYQAMPGQRLAEDLLELQERWGFHAVRFLDANWGISQKRTREFCEELVEQGSPLSWYALFQASSIVGYEPETVELMGDAGLYECMVGGETGDAEMMRTIGKRSAEHENEEAALVLARRGICSLYYYIVGYPNETAEQMLRTIDECRRICASTNLARTVIYPYRPMPGTQMWQPSLERGFVPPASLEEWGTFREYHREEAQCWPGQIPARVALARQLLEHYATLSLGLARGRLGWWERRARRRLASGNFRFARMEARAFTLYDRFIRAVNPEGERRRRWIQSGAHTSRAGERALTD